MNKEIRVNENDEQYEMKDEGKHLLITGWVDQQQQQKQTMIIRKTGYDEIQYKRIRKKPLVFPPCCSS